MGSVLFALETGHDHRRGVPERQSYILPWVLWNAQATTSTQISNEMIYNNARGSTAENAENTRSEGGQLGPDA
ncbi:hypothetical protein BDBG_16410 [Blastomyces gilchristii SLH14081]|uniref:Uncharacterized protein n=1 Tax=Blastomyces gilchristii (strain SLH14081) TaxID=559298 RepID=A0A179UAQ4_BLAGS|nr:uncharacterized protein BDBG_16410 [Blastomyces gilchristii SLH14081]OAT05096.1 hypothetical protein BDBG_16410 [Blastomyces gilchristii SLH14081]